MQPIRTRALSHARGLSMCTHLTAVEPTCQQDPMKLESFKKQTQIFRKKKTVQQSNTGSLCPFEASPDLIINEQSVLKVGTSRDAWCLR